MKINRNMSAVMTNRNLLRTEKRLSTSMERLSSGYKINRAGDNPAGLAISHKMKSQIDGLDRAKHNTTDAQSVLRIADGALNETASMLQRIRELCVQAANDTNSQDERSAIQDEIDKLVQEVDRISSDTEYNTKKLLDGSSDVLVVSTDVSRVDISDTVLPGNYSMEVTQQAEKATYAIPSLAASEGVMSINGFEVEITAGMDSDVLFGALRDAAEKAGCIATQDGAGGYNLETKEYGHSAEIEIKVTKRYMGFESSQEQEDFDRSMDALARTLGLREDAWDEDGNVTSYSAKETGEDIQLELQETEDVTRVTARATKAAVTVTNPNVDGTFTVNGNTVTVIAGMTDDDFFAALEAAAGAGNVTRSGSSFTIESASEGATESVTLATNDQAIATAFGLDPIDPADLTAGYASTVNGQDTQTETTTEQQFSDTATVYTDGLHVKITDLGGFSMEFMINESVNTAAADAAATPPDPANPVDPIMVGIKVTDIGAMTIQMGANQYQDMDIRIPEVSARTLYLDKVDVRVSGGPDKALGIMDDAINKLNDVRARIGAFTNRLEYAERSLEETHEDMTSAYSTILDTDMAEAMVEYTQQNVLEQASISVLSQANDIPQQVLSLLQ